MCWNILPNTTELPESGEWISAQLVGAWYRVRLPKAFKMTKVMIEQRSWENSQIKEVAIKFDEGPSLKVCLSLVLYHLKMNGFSLNVDYVFFCSSRWLWRKTSMVSRQHWMRRNLLRAHQQQWRSQYYPCTPTMDWWIPTVMYCQVLKRFKFTTKIATEVIIKHQTIEMGSGPLRWRPNVKLQETVCCYHHVNLHVDTCKVTCWYM